MIQFEDYKRDLAAEQAAAELAFEEELRQKPISLLTPQEIGILYDLNESFCGVDADVEKLRQYAMLKLSLIHI